MQTGKNEFKGSWQSLTHSVATESGFPALWLRGKANCRVLEAQTKVLFLFQPFIYWFII